MGKWAELSKSKTRNDVKNFTDITFVTRLAEQNNHLGLFRIREAFLSSTGIGTRMIDLIHLNMHGRVDKVGSDV